MKKCVFLFLLNLGFTNNDLVSYVSNRTSLSPSNSYFDNEICKNCFKAVANFYFYLSFCKIVKFKNSISLKKAQQAALATSWDRILQVPFSVLHGQKSKISLSQGSERSLLALKNVDVFKPDSSHLFG